MKSTTLSSAVAALFITLVASQASASSLSDCGNIDVDANATCNVMAQGGCTVSDCTYLACSASAYADCKPTCSKPDVTCEASCDITSCEAACKVEPATFDCSGNCSATCDADCGGSCDAKCSSSSDSECKAKCQGTCKASCKGECDVKCEGTKGSVDCTARCNGSCKASCTVKGNLDCHMNCRANADVTCTTDCRASCEKPNAAIFCDGQYIDHGGNLDSCLSAIEATVTANIKYDATSSGSASCANGTCQAEGEAEASASCAVAKVPHSSGWLALGLFGAITSGIVLRRRQRGSK